jgi:hypothetical protein
MNAGPVAATTLANPPANGWTLSFLPALAHWRGAASRRSLHRAAALLATVFAVILASASATFAQADI